MKKVVLIGDSIRLGYEATVKTQLGGLAEIWSPTDNCQHTVNILVNFYTWIQAQQPDILHINAGGWDVRNVIRGQPGNIVPLDHYRANVDRLLALTARHTRAKIIWGTITPVDIPANFNHHAATGHPGRHEGDIEQYNATAIEVARRHGVFINDLYSVVLSAGKSTMLCPDGVHMTDAGYIRLGTAVSSMIRPLL